MADDKNNELGPLLRASPEKPWWAPDAQGFTVASVLFMTATALFWRMGHPTEVNDKLLDMMLTLLFGTAFVGIVNFQIGASRGSQSKDDTQNKIMEKLTSPPPNGPVAPVPSPPAPTVVVSWWSLMNPDEKTAIESLAKTDDKIKLIHEALMSGTAQPPDIAALVAAGLLTKERAVNFKTV